MVSKVKISFGSPERVSLPFLRMKRKLGHIILNIIDSKKRVETKADLLKVMKLVDETANHTDSKIRV